MATRDDEIKQLRQRVDQLTTELERTSSGRVGLELERNALARSVEVLSKQVEALQAELDDLRTERPALTFDQLGSQLRQGLAAVDDVGGDGPRYRTNAASFELKVAIDSDGDQAVIRLPTIGDAIDPQLLGTFRLDVGRAGDDDPDLTGLVLVPSLNGATADGATDRLARAGLTVGQTTTRPAFGPAGSVVDQDPEGGSYVEPGTPIDVVVAAGEVDVPDLTGSTVQRAGERLAAVRLDVGAVVTRASEQPTGTVIDQTPAAGSTVAVGSAVDLSVASAPLRTVPDLGGLTPDEAKERLAEVELTLGRVGERVGDGPKGRIVDQQPEPGSEVERGGTVAVVVARPPIQRARPVPDVVGRSRSEAIELLAGAGFTGRVVAVLPTDRDDIDEVVGQDPKAGTLRVEPEVGLTVTGSGEPVGVLRGIGPAMAKRLEAAGLTTVGQVANAEVDRIAEAMGVSRTRAAEIKRAAQERNVQRR